MRDTQLARFDLDGSYPHVFGETRRGDQRHPFDHISIGSWRHRIRYALQYKVRFRRPSVFSPLDLRWRLVGITLQSAAIYPLHDYVNICLLQRAIVRKMTILRIGEPGWHLARDDRSFHGLCPRTRRLVSQE